MIHVTVTSDRARSARTSYDVESPDEAVAAAVASWFERTDVDQEGGFVFAVVVEDDSVKQSLDRETISERISQIGSVEGDRALKARAEPSPPEQKRPWKL